MADEVKPEEKTPSGNNAETKQAAAPRPDFLKIHRMDPRFEIGALWGLLFILLVTRFDAFRHLREGFLGGISGDAGLYVWLYKSHLADLFTTPWFQTRGFYPYGQSLAWSDNFILPGLIGKFLSGVGMTDEVGYNLLILANTFFSGYFTYRLVYKLSGNFPGAFAAAVSFMTYPYIAGMMGHPQLQFTCFIPLGISALVSFASTRSPLPAAVFGFTLAAAFATTVYFSIFLVIAAITLYLALWLLRPKSISLMDHAVFAAGAGFGALPLIFLVPPYFDIVRTFGERQLYETFYFAASAVSFLASPPHTLLYSGSSTLSHEEALLFPGAITFFGIFPAFLRLSEARPLKRIAYLFAASFGICFALSALSTMTEGSSEVYLRYATALLSWISLGLFGTLMLQMGLLERKLGFKIVTNRALVAIFLFLALMTFLIALGPLGNPEKSQLALGVHRAWYELLPGMDSLRAISRIGILTAFSICVVLGLAIAHFMAKFPKYGKAAFALPLLILIENYYTVIPIDNEIHASTIYDNLAMLPHTDDALIVLPMTQELNEQRQPESWGEFARRNVGYMLKVFPTRWRMMNGYSGQRSKIMREFPQQLAGFPDQRSIRTLCSIAGLRYLVYASKGLPEFNQTAFMEKLNLLSGQIQYMNADVEGNYLFELPCLSRITDQFELLVPSSPVGVVHFEISAPTIPPGSKSKLLAMTKVGDEDIPVATIEIEGGPQWQSLSIPIPITKERVRPLRVTIKAPQGKEILIKDTRFQVTDTRSWFARTF